MKIDEEIVKKKINEIVNKSKKMFYEMYTVDVYILEEGMLREGKKSLFNVWYFFDKEEALKFGEKQLLLKKNGWYSDLYFVEDESFYLLQIEDIIRYKSIELEPDEEEKEYEVLINSKYKENNKIVEIELQNKIVQERESSD